jgi:hypothetical protein
MWRNDDSTKWSIYVAWKEESLPQGDNIHKKYDGKKKYNNNKSFKPRMVDETNKKCDI